MEIDFSVSCFGWRWIGSVIHLGTQILVFHARLDIRAGEGPGPCLLSVWYRDAMLSGWMETTLSLVICLMIHHSSSRSRPVHFGDQYGDMHKGHIDGSSITVGMELTGKMEIADQARADHCYPGRQHFCPG